LGRNDHIPIAAGEILTQRGLIRTEPKLERGSGREVAPRPGESLFRIYANHGAYSRQTGYGGAASHERLIPRNVNSEAVLHKLSSNQIGVPWMTRQSTMIATVVNQCMAAFVRKLKSVLRPMIIPRRQAD
jgi:hypothetical protein